LKKGKKGAQRVNFKSCESAGETHCKGTFSPEAEAWKGKKTIRLKRVKGRTLPQTSRKKRRRRGEDGGRKLVSVGGVAEGSKVVLVLRWP